MSRDWLLYLDDLVASAEKIDRLIGARDLPALRADEASYDAVLFNLQVIGEAVKQFPVERRATLPEAHRAGPVARPDRASRLRHRPRDHLGRGHPPCASAAGGLPAASARSRRRRPLSRPRQVQRQHRRSTSSSGKAGV